MRHFAVSAIGRDQPGIVAAVSEVLLEHQVNLEDSQMTILRGEFAIMLVVSAPDDVDAAGLQDGLERVRDELGLDALTLSEVSGADAAGEPAPSHIVTVYGVDHPGIVHAVTAALAKGGINITDLETRLVESGTEPIYAMMLEVALPKGTTAEDVEQALGDVRESERVELTVRPLERDTL